MIAEDTQLVSLASGADPGSGLRAVAALRSLLERLERLQVNNARAQGWSWNQIACELGVTKQSVHKKHSKSGLGPLRRGR